MVDDDTGLVRFPAAIVEKYRKMAPPSFTFCGRDPKYDRTIPDDGRMVVTGRARRRSSSTLLPAPSVVLRRTTSPASPTW